MGKRAPRGHLAEGIACLLALLLSPCQVTVHG